MVPITRENHFRFCPYDGEELATDVDAAEGRAFCRACDFVDYQNPVACVAIFIVRDGNQVLLARRGVEPRKGEWDLPGGFVEAGEAAEAAVVREAFEETTLRVQVREYLGSVSDVYGTRDTRTLNLCFLVDVVEGSPEPQSDVESLEWFALDDLPRRMAFTHQEEAIRMLKGRLKP